MTSVTPDGPVKPTTERAEPQHVGTDLVAQRCPSCSAFVRPEALWCSLCHHDLRPAPAPEPVVTPQVLTPSYGGQDPLTAPLLDLVLPPVPVEAAPALAELSAMAAPEPVVAPAPAVPAQRAAVWPCVRCGATNDLTEDMCRECGGRFLQPLAAQAPGLVLPLVGDVTKLSRGNRAAVAGAIVGLVLVPLALLTFLLTGEPPAATSTGDDVIVTTTAP